MDGEGMHTHVAIPSSPKLHIHRLNEGMQASKQAQVTKNPSEYYPFHCHCLCCHYLQSLSLDTIQAFVLHVLTSLSLYLLRFYLHYLT